MKQFKIRVLQTIADSIIAQLCFEENQMMYDMLIRLGVWLDDYAVSKGIYLD
jgi:hypothetical protein